MTNAGFTRIDQYADVEAHGQYEQATAAGMPVADVLAGLAAMGRDNARTPMPWSADGGFTSGTPWLPLNATTDTVNVADDVADPDGVAAHYRALIALRKEEAVVRDGAFELLLPEDEKLWVFTRTLGDERLLVVANMTSHLASVPVSALPPLEDAELVLSSVYPGTDLQTLAPWDARVYRLRA